MANDEIRFLYEGTQAEEYYGRYADWGARPVDLMRDGLKGYGMVKTAIGGALMALVVYVMAVAWLCFFGGS